MMIRDLEVVERQLGFQYEMNGKVGAHYQQVCPKCRRALFGLAQGQMWSESRSAELRAQEQSDGAQYE
jgi:hypothetical protein